MDLLTSLLAPIPASKWRGRMCGSNREESTIETLWPLQNTDGLSCHTPPKWPKSGRTADGKEDLHQYPHPNR